MKILALVAAAGMLGSPLSSFLPIFETPVVHCATQVQSKTPQTKLSRTLELTQEQQESLKKLGDDLRKTTKELRKTIADNRKKVRDMIASGAASSEANAILKENTELERKIDAASLDVHDKIQALLSPTQREKLLAYNKPQIDKQLLKQKELEQKYKLKNQDDDEDTDGPDDCFAYSFSFNGDSNIGFGFDGSGGVGDMLPKGERELLFPSGAFAFSVFGDGFENQLEELSEQSEMMNKELELRELPRFFHAPKPPRPPKAPMPPRADVKPQWDFDVDIDEADEPDPKLDAKIEELEKKLRELEKRIEKKTPKQ